MNPGRSQSLTFKTMLPLLTRSLKRLITDGPIPWRSKQPVATTSPTYSLASLSLSSLRRSTLTYRAKQLPMSLRAYATSLLTFNALPATLNRLSSNNNAPQPAEAAEAAMLMETAASDQFRIHPPNQVEMTVLPPCTNALKPRKPLKRTVSMSSPITQRQLKMMKTSTQCRKTSDSG